MVSIVLAVSIILRLYPTIFHGAPWGTDGWPLFKDAQQLLANTPTTLGGNSAVFSDQYDIYWPAVIVFGAANSLIFNSIPIQVMPVITPVAAALSTLVLFVVIEKITRNSLAAFVGSLFFTSASFDSLFTASATKETFAYPLFVAGMLILYLSTKEFSLKYLALFVLISAALVLSHYAIAVLFVALVTTILIARYVVSLSRYSKKFDSRLLLLPVSLAIVMGSYLYYAWPGFGIPVTLSDVLSASSFLALSTATSLYFTFKKKITVVMPAIILGIGILILIASSLVPLLPFVPVIPSSLIFDAVPYLIVGLLALVGHAMTHRSLEKEEFSFLAIWLAVPLAFFGYSVFGTANGLDLVYRLFTFIYLPAAIFGGVALSSFFYGNTGDKPSFSRLKRGIALLGVVVIGLLCISQSYFAVAQGQNLLGGQWGYSPSDVSSAAWVKLNLPQNRNVSGDSKILYLYGYYDVGVEVSNGYQDLVQGVSDVSLSPLVTDKIMQQDGYNIQLYGNPLPFNWTSILIQRSSLVFTNGNEEIWY